MNQINKEWHLQNKMPKKPTPKQRLDWHLEHAKHCSCRTLTADMLEKLKQAAK